MHNGHMKSNHQWMETLRLRWPVVQAPMAGSQGVELALAVSQAGGLGSLPAATLSLEALDAALRTLQASGLPYNVNAFAHAEPAHDAAQEAAWLAALQPLAQCWNVTLPTGPAKAARQPFSESVLDVLGRYRPPVVSFHFGAPKPEWLAAIKAWGGQVWSSATTVDEGLWLQEQGCDVVVAQGLEAGGHRGHFLRANMQDQMGLMSLLPQLVGALKVPVLAAGGVANAAGVQAAKRLGAAGVQVGTAYLYCPEATPHPLHKAALQSARAGHTQLTNLFTGRPARGIVNGLMQALGDSGHGGEALSSVAPAFPLATHALVPLRAAAEAQGHDDFIPLWAGQSAALCQPMSAADLTLQLGQAWQDLK